jgi:hypothetical protein
VPNDMRVSEIRVDNREIMISVDQIPKINQVRPSLKFFVDKESVEPVKIEQATKIAHVEDYRRFYQRSKSIVSYDLRDVFHTPDQIYNFRLEENEAMKVAGDREYKTIMEVITMGLNQSLFKRLEEKDVIIQDLTTRLEKFERKLSFVPSGLVLPEGYFDDLVE